MAEAAVTLEENSPLEPLKKLWINLERAAVTITQGTEMAEAAVTLEENSPLEPLKKLWINLERAAVTITQGTEMAEAAVTLEEDRLFGSRRLAKAHKAFHDASTTLLRSAGHISGVWLHHHEDYFSRGTELSGGFNEGAGDDLPLIRQVEQAKDSRYGESAVRKGYSADAFKD